MPEAKDPWFEERHYRRNAINGSRKLLIAIMRSQGILLWQKPKHKRVQVSTAGLFERSAKVAKFEAPAAEFYRLHPDSLHNVGRRRWYARPRQVVMYLAHAFGNASLPEIGRHFGKDHTTVLHACRAVKASEQLMFEASEILTEFVKSGDNSLRKNQEDAIEQTVKTQAERLAA